jgi:hypothetical protein
VPGYIALPPDSDEYPGLKTASWAARLPERFFLAASLLTFVAAVAPHHLLLAESLSPDGVAYLDLARALAAGDWQRAGNSYWAPGLPLLLSLFQPLAARASPSVAWLQAPMALVSLAWFAAGYLLLRQLWREQGWTSGEPLDPSQISAGCVFLALLTAAHVHLASPESITPDQLAGIFVLLAAAILWRIHAHGIFRQGRFRQGLFRQGLFRQGLAAGFVLGLAYLAKYPLFVFTLLLVFLLCWRYPRLALGLALGFSALALPWTFLLRHNYARWTFADSGWLNFAWFTAQAPQYVGSGLSPGVGKGEALWQWQGWGTYYPWLDPARFHTGLTLEIPWVRLAKNVWWHLSWFAASPKFALAAAFFILLCLVQRPKLDWSFWWPVLAIGSYLPITLMSRYAAVWVFLLLAPWAFRALLAQWSQRWSLGASALILLASFAALGRIPEQRRLAQAQLEHALQLQPKYAGQSVCIRGDGFAASLVLARINARIIAQRKAPQGKLSPEDASNSRTIERLWQISDF